MRAADLMTPNDNVLEIADLKVWFDVHAGTARAVDGVSLKLRRGRFTALVGESGCGKSVTAFSVLRLIQKPGRIAGGKILFHPREGESVDIAALRENDERLFQIRGGKIGMIFQEPMTALSPVHTIGNQIVEGILLHRNVSARQADDLAVAMLRKVGIPGAEQRLRQYPHEMSGGMRQRVVIAMALACSPELLIADEPTTAIDVTIQAQVLRLMKDLQRELGTSVLLITHDLGVVAQTADDVAVMYLGRVVEQASVRDVMKAPRHPYTRGLLASLPIRATERTRLPSIAGSVPSLTDLPAGCPFHPRCPHAKPGVCDVGGPPPLEVLPNGQKVACLLAEEIG
jgi:oligopeptide/dipeptide ABC transporter ATP-binding protein